MATKRGGRLGGRLSVADVLDEDGRHLGLIPIQG